MSAERAPVGGADEGSDGRGTRLGEPGHRERLGLDNGITRTPEFSTPTTFRQWCAEVLKPTVDV